MPTTEERIVRIEILMGVAQPPQEWGITAERIMFVSAARGCGIQAAKRALIENFGKPLPEELSK